MRSSLIAALASAVDALACLDADELSAAELQELIAAVGPQGDRLAGVVSGAVGALQVRTGGVVPSAPGTDGRPGPAVAVRHWLRDTLGCGAPAAGVQVRLALHLRELPAVAAAVREGRVGAEQARVLTRLVGRISADSLLACQDELVEVAAARAPQELSRWVAHLLATHCEPHLEHQARTAESRRYLQIRDNGDGTHRGSFVLPDEQVEGVLTVLEPLARPAGLDDQRSAGQRRADVLVEVFDLALRHADLPDAGGARPQATYVIPAGWIARQPPPPLTELVRASLPSESGDTSTGTGTGTGAGTGTDTSTSTGCRPVEQHVAVGMWTGPQTRERIETMLCDARTSRAMLDPAGQVTGLESLTDNVTKAQRRALVARDLGCAARGCTQPPAFCDAHHLIARADGGESTLDNLVLLCRRHHLLWHQGRIQLRHLHVPWLRAPALTGAGPPGRPAA